MTRYWCDIGTSGIRTPASRPISAANIPPQLTTTSQSMSPRSVRHAASPGRAATSMPVTRVCGRDTGHRPPGRRRRASSRAATGRGSRPTRGTPRRRTPSVSISGNRSAASATEISCSGRSKVLAQLICRRISSQPLGAGRELDAAALGPARPADRPPAAAVELDRVHVHPGQRRVGAQLPDQAGGVEGRAAGQLVTVEHHDVALAELGQVVGHARPADPAADHHDPGGRRAGLAARSNHATSCAGAAQDTRKGLGSRPSGPEP